MQTSARQVISPHITLYDQNSLDLKVKGQSSFEIQNITKL